MWNIDQGVPCHSCKPKKSNRSPTVKVCEHKECHTLGHGGVELRCRRVVAADSEINASITLTYQHTRQTVNEEQAHELHLVAQVAIFHWQANAEKKKIVTTLNLHHLLLPYSTHMQDGHFLHVEISSWAR